LDKWTKQRLLSNVVTDREINEREDRIVREQFGGDWEKFDKWCYENDTFCGQWIPTENYPYSHY